MTGFNPMEAADQFKQFVEAMTGMKAMFVEAGWSEDVAEQMVLQALKSGNAN